MNMFKSDEGSTAPPPVGVPPRPSNETPSIVSKAPSSGSLEEGPNSTQKPWMLKGVLQKVNPFRFTSLVPKSDLQNDSAGPPETGKELKDTQNSGMIAGMMQKVNPFKSSQPKDTGPLHSDLSFSNGSLADSNNWPEKQDAMEVEMLEMAEVPVPSKGTVLDPLDDEEGLLAWWRTVEDWDEWTEANQNDEEVVEQVADRVFMAARLFVHFFNQRGVSLQQRILELLDLADTADIFHKKTVTTSVGGGVASVAGSITTITGLILAPFTAGTSLIVTAVGIGIATAGGVASASANITDTVHSKMDRKKVEKMIQDYQEEIKDIKECLEFLQTKSEASVRGGEFTYKVNAKTCRAAISCWTLLGEKKARRLNYLEGMETLEEWNFEKYAESISKKHLNQNVKHVMKEGGRAGKALVINTESLISTIQVLNVAGGAAKAAQVMSVTTGLMSGLFLALDVFFLAKDSMELKKGAKTEFAAKIREVCKDLQNGLLELNRIKEQVQKTMDGIEVEVEEGELLKSDLKKLVELKK